jgi:mRNA-decapping enzyme 1B
MESTMNISALKLVDPYVKSIMETAAHVALYSFNAESYEWEKLNVEGALFICIRCGEPKHNIMILNRLNTYNLIEPIVDGLELQQQDPFLLYRNVQGHINGIWFYEKEECVRIAGILSKLVKPSSKSLVSMNKPPDPKAEATSKRVMDFFAKASSNAPSQAPGGFIAPPPGIPHKQDGQSPAKPLLQRLMSNPVKTVEQIEKQQRCITPQKEPLNLRKKHDKSNTRPVSLGAAMSAQQSLENGLGFLRINENSPTASIPTQQFFNSTLVHSDLESSLVDTPSKPELIPPVVFAASAKKEESLSLSVRPEPLTKSQLLQAVSYLLKNDSDFINKLHEAYVKSFVDMVS